MAGPRCSRGGAFVVLAALTLAAAALLPSAQARRASLWAGTWSTDWGTMVLQQSGASVTGTYTHDSGHITGTASGFVVTGTWDEAPTRKGPKDAGPFRWTMNADLTSFSGTWSYADGSPGGGWSGTRTSAPPTSSTPTNTTGADTTPPVVHANGTGRLRPATRARLTFTVSDDSGRAKVYAGLYQDGRLVRRAASGGLQPATGGIQVWNALLASDLTGPLFYCVWARDAAGNRSANAPKSSCAWLSMVVRIERVSNGCGGAGWGAVAETAQNYLGNTSTYKDSNVNPLARSYTVDFAPACDLHDAGYSGVTVADGLNGGVVDFRRWSRRRVDQKFLADMRLLCRRQIPASATTALTNCMQRGGNVSIGAVSRFDFVRSWGSNFFDADLTVPGQQEAGSAASRPPGGVRDNG